MRMYLLDKKQRVRRWLKDNDFIEAEMTEEINAANQINFSIPLKDRIADNIYYVAIPTPRSKQKYLLFKLLSERVQNDRIEYAVENLRSVAHSSNPGLAFLRMRFQRMPPLKRLLSLSKDMSTLIGLPTI